MAGCPSSCLGVVVGHSPRFDPDNDEVVMVDDEEADRSSAKRHRRIPKGVLKHLHYI